MNKATSALMAVTVVVVVLIGSLLHAAVPHNAETVKLGLTAVKIAENEFTTNKESEVGKAFLKFASTVSPDEESLLLLQAKLSKGLSISSSLSSNAKEKSVNKFLVAAQGGTYPAEFTVLLYSMVLEIKKDDEKALIAVEKFKRQNGYNQLDINQAFLEVWGEGRTATSIATLQCFKVIHEASFAQNPEEAIRILNGFDAQGVDQDVANAFKKYKAFINEIQDALVAYQQAQNMANDSVVNIGRDVATKGGQVVGENANSAGEALFGGVLVILGSMAVQSDAENQVQAKVNAVWKPKFEEQKKRAKAWIAYCSTLTAKMSQKYEWDKTTFINVPVSAAYKQKQNADPKDAADQFILGETLDEDGDAPTAIKWFTKAAEQGHVRAQLVLGYRYAMGVGVEKNPTEAAMWYLRINDEKKVQNEFFTGSTPQDFGLCFLTIMAYPQGDKEAYRKAAIQGSCTGCLLMGLSETDNVERLKWYRMATEKGSMMAPYMLAVCYEKGTGVEKNLGESVKWLRKAADQGFVLAQCGLADCYKDGTGVEKNLGESVKWLRKAADQGFMLAQCGLADCYKDGTGVEKNTAEAVKWFQMAAKQGNEEAKKKLKDMEASVGY